MNLLLAPDAVLFWLTTCITVPLLILALIHAPWRLLLADESRQHALFTAVLSLGVLWLLRISVRDTIAFHPVLMTVTTMVFGWSFALLIGALALVMLKIYQLAIFKAVHGWDVALAQFDLSSIPVDFCLSVAVPVGWAACVIWLVNHWKFKNPFTYFLGVGFFGAMASCLLTDISAYLLFAIAGSEAQLATMEDQFFTFLLMTFPEGFINGTIATSLTVLWPDIVKTYHDDWFLQG